MAVTNDSVARTSRRRTRNAVASQRPTTVLVVDDDRAVRDSTTAILGAEGYTVVRAEDGYEALDLLRSNQIDLVLLDLKLPRVDGVSLLRVPMRFPPVVLLTGLSQVDEMGLRTQFGSSVVDVLRKPVPPRKLLDAMSAAMRRVRWNKRVGRRRELFALQVLPSESGPWQLRLLGEVDLSHPRC